MVPAGIGDRVEGVHAVAAAVEAGRVTDLYVEAQRLDRPPLREVVERARAQGASIEIVDDIRQVAESQTPQGIAARARPRPTVGLDEAVAAVHPAALVVLDHLQDSRNVGAIARSALAAGFGGIVVPERRSAPLGVAAFKAAAGALERLPVVFVSSVGGVVRQLGRMGVWTLGLSGGGAASLFGHQLLTEPLALVVGGEERGLSPLVSDRADVIVRIPLLGGVDSLNASVAAAIASFEVARARGWLSDRTE